jgi:spoIIIJ-associated protein
MDSIEIEAKTVEEAISIACEQLGRAKEQLSIEVLQEASNKIFSFMSGKKAKIRATVIRSQPDRRPAAPAEIGQTLKEMLETIAHAIDPAASVELLQDDEGIALNIKADGSGIFIGKRGQTLDALHYLMNKIKMKYCDDSVSLTVDSESYRARHKQNLESLAKQLGSKAKKRNGPVTTNPLNSSDRRIIHITLKNDTDLTTWSKGDGAFKKVIIAPKESAQ